MTPMKTRRPSRDLQLEHPCGDDGRIRQPALDELGPRSSRKRRGGDAVVGVRPSTSTHTMMSASAPMRTAPERPQSNRTWYLDWERGLRYGVGHSAIVGNGASPRMSDDGGLRLRP